VIAIPRQLFPPYLGDRMQLAFVVPDLHESLRFWTENLKVGPFVVMRNATRDRRFMYRGELSKVEMDLAFAYLGDIQIEVIHQTNSAPSPYSDFLKSGRQGLHHVAFWPKDFDASCAELERTGWEKVCDIHAAAGGGVVNYYDGPGHLGVMLEIAPMTPDRARYFGGIKGLAQTWDGTRPIRTFDSRAEYMASDDCKPVPL
jgi:catechol 2,3-dioxygenase-like lactoylglutathione lyase family enzyme